MNLLWTEVLVVFIISVNIALTAVVIWRERKNTTSTWAWIFVLNVLPIFGILLYILVGRGISKRRILGLRAQLRPTFDKDVASTREMLDEENFLQKITKNTVVKQLIHMLFFKEEAIISTNTRVELFTDGRVKFDRLLEDIEGAKHHVHVQYYIFRMDHIGEEVYQALVAACKRGVEVRLLVDAWGSRNIRMSDVRELVDLGGHVAFFFPSIFRQINPRFNYRQHRKIVVIDGQIAYMGGFNVGDEYVTVTKKFGYWRDTHLRLTGDIVYSLQDSFIIDWNSQHKDEIVQPGIDYYPKPMCQGDVVAQYVTSGPDEPDQRIKMTYLKMIHSAVREITIQTPYYIPDRSVHEALLLAIASGVSVNIMIPNKPDHPFVYWATYYFTADLVRHGAQAWTYENGFVHTKAIAIDSEYISIGSANFDNRSFALDFEGNLVLYDAALTQRFKADFAEDVKLSKKLTMHVYEQRSLFVRFREGLARLLGPLL